MTTWAAIYIVVGYAKLGVVEADSEEDARRLARALAKAAPAQSPCPVCQLYRMDEGVDVRKVVPTLSE